MIDKIKSLSELEMASLLQEIDTHLTKSGMLHLVDEAFCVWDLEGEIEDLEEKVANLEIQRDELQDKINDIWAMADDSDIEDDDQDAVAKLRKIIEDINDKAA